MRPFRTVVAVAAALVASAAAAQVQDPDGTRLQPHRIAEFGTGEFLESVIEQAGWLYISSLQSGRIYRVDPSGGTTIWATLPAGRPGTLSEGIFCLAADGAGGVYVNLLSPDTSVHGVWHVDGAGVARRIATLPPHVIPNGLARHSSGDLYLADSAVGGIWRVRRGAGAAVLWADSPLLRPREHGRQYPAVNGLQIRQDRIYATVSDTGRVVGVDIRDDGSAGTVLTLAEGIGGDDFAVDDDGTLYVTTHPGNSIVRIAPDRSTLTVAGVEQDLIGPTAATIASGPEGGRTLYVVTDGGSYAPQPGGPVPARLLGFRLPN